jgi:hypothetical protein
MDLGSRIYERIEPRENHKVRAPHIWVPVGAKQEASALAKVSVYSHLDPSHTLFLQAAPGLLVLLKGS